MVATFRRRAVEWGAPLTLEPVGANCWRRSRQGMPAGQWARGAWWDREVQGGAWCAAGLGRLGWLLGSAARLCLLCPAVRLTSCPSSFTPNPNTTVSTGGA